MRKLVSFATILFVSLLLLASSCAPRSDARLEREGEVLVFSFEPTTSAVWGLDLIGRNITEVSVSSTINGNVIPLPVALEGDMEQLTIISFYLGRMGRGDSAQGTLRGQDVGCRIYNLYNPTETFGCKTD